MHKFYIKNNANPFGQDSVSAARGPIGLRCRTISATSGKITAKFGRIVSRIIRKYYCAHPVG